MSEISKAIDVFLRENLDSQMKRSGFKKVRRRYRLVSENRAEQLIVEASSWNQFGEGRFTVYLTVVIPHLARLVNNVDVLPAQAKGYESGIHTTLGSLMPSRIQDSWKVIVGERNENEGASFREAIEAYALPWFQRTRTTEGLVESLEQNQSFDALQVLAVLYTERGEPELARRKLEEIVERRPDLAEWLRAWAAKAGVRPLA